LSSTVLVTGASRGLGTCLVERYAAEGWRVIAGRREPSERLAVLVQRLPDQVFAVDLDVTSSASIAAAEFAVAERLSSLDVLVNNAAILPTEARGQIGRLDCEAGLRVYDVNALGPLRVTEAFLPMLERGERRLIVNISSEAGSVTDCWRKDDYFYCMSKAALNMQSAILRNALEARGIEVLAIHPGWMRTDMGGQDADIDPTTAAEGIFRITAQRRDREAGIYLDYRGRPMRW
jgi:NAD(P)-dependent dehydrogenase (short-subunit alcohol dehydrogenase family)